MGCYSRFKKLGKKFPSLFDVETCVPSAWQTYEFPGRVVEFTEHLRKRMEIARHRAWPFSSRHGFTPHVITSCKSRHSPFSSLDHRMTALAETNSRWDDMYLWTGGDRLPLTYCRVSFSRLAFLFLGSTPLFNIMIRFKTCNSVKMQSWVNVLLLSQLGLQSWLGLFKNSECIHPGHAILGNVKHSSHSFSRSCSVRLLCFLLFQGPWGMCQTSTFQFSMLALEVSSN